MASSRTLGRGRVLGTAKPGSPTAVPEHVLHTGLLSPSESSVSLSSQISTSRSSNEDDGISAVAALQARDNIAAAMASSRMACPICNEEMVTLLQLNRHLDDDHQNLEVVEQDEVKTWFKAQMVKAKKFQPLAVFNQKLKGPDVFESNGGVRSPSNPRIGNATSDPPKLEQVRLGPDEVVTREHWQRYTDNGACSDPMCGRRLGAANGNINCRKCGKLFCDEHTMYQMKLSRSAQYEPVRGFWCRVCETCYKSREGYNDHTGLERDHTDDFAKLQQKVVDKSYLEVSRLEKRLTKITQLLTDQQLDQEQSALGFLWSFSSAKAQRHNLERSVVDWEDDASVLQCPFCQQEFSNYTFRRHHCRLCGRVICGDPLTACSTNVGLDVATQADDLSEKGAAQIGIDIRMCKDCKYTIFSKSDFASELAFIPPDQRAYQNLKQFERGIRVMLPRFETLLSTLQDPDQPPTSAQVTEATKVRRRLTDSFTQYDVAARRIRDMPTLSPTQIKLQKQVYVQASQFLHLHMLPLKSLPKLLKHASPDSAAGSSSTLHPNGYLHHATHNRSPLAAIKSSHSASVSQDTTTSTTISSLESEEKSLRERLIVLEEQKFLVGEMFADAQRRRKFEEVESLGRNLEDLGKEVDQVQGMLGGLDFESAYIGAGISNAARGE